MAFAKTFACLFVHAAIAMATISLVVAQSPIDPNLEVVQRRSPIGLRRSSQSFRPSGTDGQPIRVSSSHNDLFPKGWAPPLSAQRIGSNQGFCIEVYNNVSYECFFSFGFGRPGSLTVQGPYKANLQPSTLLVTGGSGFFERYRGSVTLTPDVPPGHFTWSFKLFQIIK